MTVWHNAVTESQHDNEMVEELWSSVLKGDCVWVTHFKHRSLHKYIRMVRGQDRVEVKSIIDPVLVKKDMLQICGGG